MKPTWVRDEVLEAISDKIRGGEPVGIMEAVAAIQYNDEKNEYLRANKWCRRIFARLRSIIEKELSK